MLLHNVFPHLCIQSSQTALAFAARNGHVEIVHLLLKRHANANICHVVSTVSVHKYLSTYRWNYISGSNSYCIAV